MALLHRTDGPSFSCFVEFTTRFTVDGGVLQGLWSSQPGLQLIGEFYRVFFMVFHTDFLPHRFMNFIL